MQPFSLPFRSIETKNHKIDTNVTILLPNLQTLRLCALCEKFFFPKDTCSCITVTNKQATELLM